MKIESRVAVHLILTNDRGECLFLRRFNTGYKDGEYGLVSGHVEEGENLKAAMIREACEEVGITLSPDDLDVIGVIPSLPNSYVYFFLHADTWSGDVKNMEPHKCDDIRWFDLRSSPDNTVFYVRQAVENHLEGRWFSEVENRHTTVAPGSRTLGCHDN